MSLRHCVFSVVGTLHRLRSEYMILSIDQHVYPMVFTLLRLCRLIRNQACGTSHRLAFGQDCLTTQGLFSFCVSFRVVSLSIEEWHWNLGGCVESVGGLCTAAIHNINLSIPERGRSFCLLMTPSSIFSLSVSMAHCRGLSPPGLHLLRGVCCGEWG